MPAGLARRSEMDDPRGFPCLIAQILGRPFGLAGVFTISGGTDGMPTTHADTINADLLAFLES